MESLHQEDSNSMFCLDAGHGKPVVLVHGWGVSGALFSAQVDALQAQSRVLVPDLRGHGQSAPFSPGDGFSVFADDLAAMIQARGLESVCLVGWSMGAMVCWDLLKRHPQVDVSGLVTIDMVPWLHTSPDWPYGLRDENDHGFFASHASLMQADWEAYCHLFVPRIFARGRDTRSDALVAQTMEIAINNHASSLATIWQRMGEQDFRQSLGEIGIPVQVVAGRLSQLYGVSAAEWVTGAIENARLEVFEHSGHAPHMEEPESFNAMLTAFLGELHGSHKSKSTVPGIAG